MRITRKFPLMSLKLIGPNNNLLVMEDDAERMADKFYSRVLFPCLYNLHALVFCSDVLSDLSFSVSQPFSSQRPPKREN